LPQQVKRINLFISVDNSSKQMQQTSGSSSCCCGDAAAFEVVVLVVVVCLLMVYRLNGAKEWFVGNCFRLQRRTRQGASAGVLCSWLCSWLGFAQVAWSSNIKNKQKEI
jgi:hypothetical protein